MHHVGKLTKICSFEKNECTSYRINKEIKQTKILSKSSNELVFGVTPETKSKVDDYCAWADNEFQLLETTRDLKAKKACEGVNLESLSQECSR